MSYLARLKKLEELTRKRAQAAGASRLIKTWLDLMHFAGQSPEARRFGLTPRYHTSWEPSVKLFREAAANTNGDNTR